MSLGTSQLVASNVDFLKDFSKKYVTALAMNQDEAMALTGHEDPLLSAQDILDFVDIALVTVGKKGLYMACYTDDEVKRETKEPLVSFF